MATRYELAQRLVEREVIYCVSQLVSDLADTIGNYKVGDLDEDELYGILSQQDWQEAGRSFIMDDADFEQLEQVADMFGYWSDVLAESGAPEGLEDVEAYAEADPGWGSKVRQKIVALVDDWQEVGDEFRLEPDINEAYEHWIVSNWLAEKLREKGEMVADDILGLVVWGRCTTGQSIELDYVIEQVASEIWADELEVQP